MDETLKLWSELAGFGALVAVVLNGLKYSGIVKAGSAGKWAAALNLAGVAIVLLLGEYKVDLAAVDNLAAAVASVGTVVLGYVVSLVAAKTTHGTVRGLPVVGKSLT